MGAQLLLDDGKQRRKVLVDRAPQAAFASILLVMTIDISCPSDLAPAYRRMTILQGIRKSAGRFGKDLERSRHGVDGSAIFGKPLVVEALNKLGGAQNVFGISKR